MGWGAMIGGGQALQQVGSMIMDYNKAEMKNKLEMERETRQNQLQLDKEAREEARVVATPVGEPLVVPNGDGTMSLQGLNKYGDPIESTLRPMTTFQMEQFNREQQAAKDRAEANSIDVLLKRKDAERDDEEWDLTRRGKLATISASEAAAAASRARAANAGSSGSRGGSEKTPPTKADVETAVYDRYKSLIDETKTEYGVSEVAIQAALARAVENEAKRGLPYGSTFQATLTQLAQDNRSKVSTIKGE